MSSNFGFSFATLRKRVRTLHREQALLATLTIPNVYIFNVGSEEFPNRIAPGKTYTIHARKAGEEYSEPTIIPMLSIYEFDPAEGGNQMGTRQAFAMSKEIDGMVEIGVANDVIGTNSSSAALSLYTTNLEWHGVFATLNEVPTEEELSEARSKLRARMELVYATGAEKVEAGEKVPMIDRPRYNEAAAYLGRKPLWGNLDHTRGECPECGEDIREGANFCKNCNQAIDPASVAARAKKRQREAEKLLKEEETA